MLTKEKLLGKFVETKGRNKEIQEVANRLGFVNVYSKNRDTAELLIFDKFGYTEWENNKGYCKQHYTEIKVEEILEEMKEYKVSEQFIKEAHKVACSTWKAKLEEQFPEVFPRTYKIGNIFEHNDTEVLLAAVDTKMCCLIDIRDGNRYQAPVAVDNVRHITIEEINKMTARFDEFKLKQ